LNRMEDNRPFEQSYNWSKSDEWSHTGLSYTQPPEIFAEKPYISWQGGRYYLNIPRPVERHAGPNWDPGESIDFMQVFVVQKGSKASEINAKISAGLHVVFPPGIYILDEPLVVNKNGTVILGLGYATLVPKFDRKPLLVVENVDNVRIAGLILQAGAAQHHTYALLQWGPLGSDYAGNRRKPGVMHDLVFRVGGPDATATGTEYMLQINNGWVVGDNLWLWLADHCVKNVGRCCSILRHAATALQVNGPHVHMYGLSAEHTEENLIEWNGPHGLIYFLQSEFIYSKPTTAVDGYSKSTGLLVAPTASDFHGVALNIYDVAVWICQDASGRLDHLRMKGGISAFVVSNETEWKHNFKDCAATNFANYWPEESRLTCFVWHESQAKCMISLYDSEPELAFNPKPWPFAGPVRLVAGFLMLLATAVLIVMVKKQRHDSEHILGVQEDFELDAYHFPAERVESRESKASREIVRGFR